MNSRNKTNAEKEKFIKTYEEKGFSKKQAETIFRIFLAVSSEMEKIINTFEKFNSLTIGYANSEKLKTDFAFYFYHITKKVDFNLDKSIEISSFVDKVIDKYKSPNKVIDFLKKLFKEKEINRETMQKVFDELDPNFNNPKQKLDISGIKLDI